MFLLSNKALQVLCHFALWDLRVAPMPLPLSSLEIFMESGNELRSSNAFKLPLMFHMHLSGSHIWILIGLSILQNWMTAEIIHIMSNL